MRRSPAPECQASRHASCGGEGGSLCSWTSSASATRMPLLWRVDRALAAAVRGAPHRASGPARRGFGRCLGRLHEGLGSQRRAHQGINQAVRKQRDVCAGWQGMEASLARCHPLRRSCGLFPDSGTSNASLSVQASPVLTTSALSFTRSRSHWDRASCTGSRSTNPFGGRLQRLVLGLRDPASLD